MKRILCAAVILLLAGCASRPADVIGTPAPLPTPAQTLETAPTSQPDQTDETAAGEYTAIQLQQQDTRSGQLLAQDGLATDGYYTMCMDGKWGLMKSDGTVLLPCISDRPIERCANGCLRWHFLSTSAPMDDAERSSYEAALAAENAGTLCTGEHDGQSYTWTYDINTGRVCKSAGMMGGAAELNDGDALYGDYLPCVRSVWTSGNGDPDYYTTAEGGGIVFANSDADLLNGVTYASAGCFYDQPLAPVKIGDKWAYLDRKGNLATEAVYDAVYGGLDFYEDYTPKYASPLLNGYAAICRDGKWGVLDAAGKEYIPCDYASAAWNGHILWLQRDGHWQSRTLPGVPEHWQDAKMRFQVGPKELKATDAFWRVTAAGGLRLRVGPDTSYEKISLVPEYTALQELGRSEDGRWMLTLYGRWHGWVSMEHLEKITQ